MILKLKYIKNVEINSAIGKFKGKMSGLDGKAGDGCVKIYKGFSISFLLEKRNTPTKTIR